LRSPTIKAVLQVSLALGNYINNPKDQVKGFKIGSLVKLTDVSSKVRPKYTLMHELAAIIEKEFKELMVFPDELAGLPDAANGMESLQVELSAIKQDFVILANEFEACKADKEKDGGNPSLDKWLEFLERNTGRIKRKLEEVDEMMKAFEEDVKYFGESSAAELGTFFKDWDKFSQSFQAAVKYNITLKRKEEALEKKRLALEKKTQLLEKKRDAKRKKKEDAVSAKKEMMRKKKEEITKKKTESSEQQAKAAEAPTAAADARRERRDSRSDRERAPPKGKGPTTPRTKSIIGAEELVSDLLGGKQQGTIKQMMTGLRSNAASNFQKIRGSRIQVPGQSVAMSLETQDKLLLLSAGYLQNVNVDQL